MQSGGYEAMLHDLLHYDLTGFNVRDVPVTDGLHEQRLRSLATPEAWWLDVLQRGYVFRSKLGLDAEFRQWHTEVSTELLYESYLAFAKEHRERHPLNRVTFGQFVQTLGLRPARLSNAAVGEHITEADGTRATRPIIKARACGYRMGAAEALCREFFTFKTRIPVAWEDEDGPCQG